MQITSLKNLNMIVGIFLLLVSQLASAKEWAFDVYLDKNKMGTHTFTFNDNQLTSKADFNVKVLFVNAYHYDHKAVELWQGNCLAKLDANTIENKVTTKVTGSLDAENFITHNADKKQQLPACVMTFAYWNPAILKQTHLLNPQNADYLDTSIKKIDTPKLEVKGQSIETTHYKIEGSLKGKKLLNIELWYDQNEDWVGLTSVTPEGYHITYKRIN